MKEARQITAGGSAFIDPGANGQGPLAAAELINRAVADYAATRSDPRESIR
jgi:hypothetical protein